jgi:RimJ/RimL family protein N-acetyltransferase
LENSSLEIRVGANHLIFSTVPWDTKLFGVDVYTLESWAMADEASEIQSGEWRASALIALKGQSAILTGRVPSNEDTLRAALSAIGMSIVEWTLHPELDLETYKPMTKSLVKMRLASKDDLGWISTEAQDAFAVSRFFRDSNVPKHLAAKRFSYWVEYSLDSPSKQVFVFEDHEHQPIGFFVVSAASESAHLELTAITADMRGKGWSMSVWHSYLGYAKSIGVNVVTTNISAENSAVIGIYPKLGFRFGQSSVAMHGHFT